MIIGGKDFNTREHCYVMGILNVTPDSFSDGGKWNDVDRALAHVEQMLEEGMDILDIGGESTRPGYTLISNEEEIGRVVPVIEAVKKRFDVPISLDTYKAGVARAGIDAGADLINDIWGLKYPGESKDDTMAKVIADSKLPCCLMHNRPSAEYVSFYSDYLQDMQGILDIADKAGIEKSKIILDPGVGFAKSYENNLECIKRLDELNKLGCPVLLGTSRKSVVGLTLDLPSNERVEGTLATTVMGVMQGAAFVRVHDIKENVRAIKMTEAIMKVKNS
ncbi:MAG: dihydropteroate synthase [Lachnospiraceae bacterium]|nr:dihydropteroate synthase [Lachnospiraceae bacterium]